MPENITTELALPLLQTVSQSSAKERAVHQPSAIPQRTPSEPVFRLFDLPPELRNRIYHFTAQAAFEVPALLAFEPNDFGYTFSDTEELFRIRDDRITAHEKRRNQGGFNRLALLGTNRQVYNEAFQIFYTNFSVDLGLMYMQPTTPKITKFTKIFQGKTQFIKHIELDATIAEQFLFGTNEDLEDLMMANQVQWKVPTSTALAQAHAIVALRSCLTRGVESVTVYPDTDKPIHQATSFIGVLGLTDPVSRWNLEEAFPHMKDMVFNNRWGSERFSRTKTGAWKQHYSGETIPIVQDNVRSIPKWFFDCETVLSLGNNLEQVMKMEKTVV